MSIEEKGMKIDFSKMKKLNQKTKLIIILAVEFVAIIAVLALIFFAGKKTHTVTFDLNGGILLGGELEQRVTQGQHATPPVVAKYGHYLRGWSGSYKSVTRNVTVKAIWEYETTPGIEYSVPENTNYCEISGSFKEIQGDVYIGAYYNERQVLGIQSGAFKDRTGITAMYLLDGILAIENEAFMGCTNLETIEIPSTVVRIGADAFRNCENLKEIILPEALITIEDGAFSGCTSLEKITFNDKLTTIGASAFKDCKALTKIKLPASVRNIGMSAFLDCAALEGAILTEGVESIDSFAFMGCTSLTEVVLPASLSRIGVSAFNTPKMTIKLCISKEKIPVGFVNGWHSNDAVLEFDFVPEVDVDAEGEEDENDGKDKDDFWGGIL